MTRVGQAQGDDNDDEEDDCTEQAIIMTVVKEILDGGQANQEFGTFQQYLSDEFHPVGEAHLAGEAANEAFAVMPVPEATCSTSAITLLRKFEKLLLRDGLSVKGKPTEGERAGKCARIDPVDDRSQ